MIYCLLPFPSCVCLDAASLRSELCELCSHSLGSGSFKSSAVRQEPAALREECSPRVTLVEELGPENPSHMYKVCTVEGGSVTD